jgi:hypothetical protein
MYSYHIFYFPFKWENSTTKGRLFSEQTNLAHIPINSNTNWLRSPDPLSGTEKEQNLYNEQNFYYKFVHPVLYDNIAGDSTEDSIMLHFEREEPQQRPREVEYIISVKDKKTYTLKVDAINLNLYATGVGMLSFFLANENEFQKESYDILVINQYGRRIFPPFFGDIDGKHETADYIQITGLNGDSSRFKEDFSQYKIHKKTWHPACFVRNLITDLSDNLEITPVIDDKMFLNCWYANDDITGEFEDGNQSDLDRFFLKNVFWYKYVFVDVDTATCQNDEMREKLLNAQTYKRWQKHGMLYGASRYSFVSLAKNNEFHKSVFAVHMQTVYSRMIELILIQRASRLRFSEEVSRVSRLSGGDKAVLEQISSLYEEYMRFINQVHFREVTTQDQGIELYQLISKTLNIEEYIEKTDREIAELHHYTDLLDDKIRNRNAEILNYIVAAFLPATLFFTLLSSNEKNLSCLSFGCKAVIGVAVSVLSVLVVGILYRIKNKK